MVGGAADRPVTLNNNQIETVGVGRLKKALTSQRVNANKSGMLAAISGVSSHEQLGGVGGHLAVLVQLQARGQRALRLQVTS